MSFTSPFAKSTSKPGHGSIIVEVLAPDAPVLKAVSYQYPLKLIAPEPLPPPDYVPLADTPRLVHTVYLLTYGGGIVAGDSIDLDAAFAPHPGFDQDLQDGGCSDCISPTYECSPEGRCCISILAGPSAAFCAHSLLAVSDLPLRTRLRELVRLRLGNKRAFS
jgi:hypothetical protein